MSVSRDKLKLVCFLKRITPWIGITGLGMMLLTLYLASCSLLAQSTLSTLLPDASAPKETVDKLLKALQQGDKKEIELLLVEPRQASKVLQQWNHHTAIAGALQSWKPTSIMRDSREVTITVGDEIKVENFPVYLEGRVRFEKSQALLKVELFYNNKEWKVNSLTIEYNITGDEKGSNIR